MVVYPRRISQEACCNRWLRRIYLPWLESQLPGGATNFKCHLVRLGRTVVSASNNCASNGTSGEYRCGYISGVLLKTTRGREETAKVRGTRDTTCSNDDCTLCVCCVRDRDAGSPYMSVRWSAHREGTAPAVTRCTHSVR